MRNQEVFSKFNPPFIGLDDIQFTVYVFKRDCVFCVCVCVHVRLWPVYSVFRAKKMSLLIKRSA